MLSNRLAVWTHDLFGIALEPGIDEVSLALVADAWSRTYRSRVESFAASPAAVATARGVRLLPDRVAAAWPSERLPFATNMRPAEALNEALQGIGARYGRATTHVVAMQLEYPGYGAQP